MVQEMHEKAEREAEERQRKQAQREEERVCVGGGGIPLVAGKNLFLYHLVHQFPYCRNASKKRLAVPNKKNSVQLVLA